MGKGHIALKQGMFHGAYKARSDGAKVESFEQKITKYMHFNY